MATAIRSLSAGHKKFVILTTKPADPKNPTLAELKAGIDASCRVKSSGFKFGPDKSEEVDSDLLCEDIKSKAYGQSNYVLEFDVYRYFDPETGQAAQTAADDIADSVFQLVKQKGTQLYYYVRYTSKKSKEDFAAGDEVTYLGGQNDWPTPDDGDGYINYHVTVAVSEGEPYAVVGGAA